MEGSVYIFLNLKDIYKMANHCEKLVKKLTEKHFKPANTPTSAPTKSSK